jgi:hypothetical protein
VGISISIGKEQCRDGQHQISTRKKASLVESEALGAWALLVSLDFTTPSHGLAAMTAAMPRFMNFEDGPERKFFAAQRLVITVAYELTRFPQEEFDRKKRRFTA